MWALELAMLGCESCLDLPEAAMQPLCRAEVTFLCKALLGNTQGNEHTSISDACVLGVTYKLFIGFNENESF